MSFTRCAAFLFFALLALVLSMGVTARTQAPGDQIKAPDFITAQELKVKVEKKQPVTIIDVRSSSALLESGSKIKGAIYVKLRRLEYRLRFPPLKDVPRDSEVVTYCACPSDEASLRAAELLLQSGFKRVRALKGGWRAWLKVNGPVEQKPRGT